MQLPIHVKAGQHTDRLWRDGSGLVAQIRAQPLDGKANIYLIRFVAGELRVPQSLVTIHRGKASSHKVLSINIPEADLRPQLERLNVSPPGRLFEAK
jgi:uncharacterized protein YggU (UPF0235/DUF167 family)